VIRNSLPQGIQIEKFGDALAVSLDVAQKRSGLNLVMLLWGAQASPKSLRKELIMNKNRFERLSAVAAQFIILIAAPGLIHSQSTVPQSVQASAENQQDPYAAAFAGLTYTDAQKEAIGKIRQDIASRRATVMKVDTLTESQKDAMLTGYARIEYELLFKELTPAQQRQVSTRMHASRAAEQAAQTKQAPSR
jgi:hypothetical protein